MLVDNVQNMPCFKKTQASDTICISLRENMPNLRHYKDEVRKYLPRKEVFKFDWMHTCVTPELSVTSQVEQMLSQQVKSKR